MNRKKGRVKKNAQRRSITTLKQALIYYIIKISKERIFDKVNVLKKVLIYPLPLLFVFILWKITDIELYLNFPIILIILIPLWIYYRIDRSRKKNIVYAKREILINIFFIYLLTVLYVTLNPFHFTPPSIKGNINLVPYVQLHYQYTYKPPIFWILYTLGNIMMFIPFGYLFPKIYQKRFKMLVTISIAALCSLLIEITQYFFTIDRAADIDDLLLNIIGAIIGYFLFLFMRKTKFPSSYELLFFQHRK
ncbi:VanZ family protein [Bacillus sp. B1-b2]|uniref:VanZ family protein n=1 Tax=Bacillus sp. B1-b2 TaxID=2653201 RepID=UPI0012619E71|nr:VanZ family protein [Bacillus sp. B1-b2]KAB7668833.1 VanZ family protein [Bacillus sp. B1-b2]